MEELENIEILRELDVPASIIYNYEGNTYIKYLRCETLVKQDLSKDFLKVYAVLLLLKWGMIRYMIKISSNKEAFLSALETSFNIPDITHALSKIKTQAYDIRYEMLQAVKDYMTSHIMNIKKGDKVFIINYKTNSFPSYEADHVTESEVITSTGKRIPILIIHLYLTFFYNHPEFFKYERSTREFKN